MICPVVSKEHFRSMRITLAFSVIALSFCIAFAVLTFAGILAQYTALCAAFFALVSSGLFLLYRFSRDISLRKLELTESEIRVFGKTGKLLKTFPYSAVRELRVVTLMVGNFVRAALNPTGACQLSFPSVDLSVSLAPTFSAPVNTTLTLPIEITNAGGAQAAGGSVRIGLPPTAMSPTKLALIIWR